AREEELRRGAIGRARARELPEARGDVADRRLRDEGEGAVHDGEEHRRERNVSEWIRSWSNASTILRDTASTRRGTAPRLCHVARTGDESLRIGPGSVLFPPMFHRLLIANRGEVAVRIARTARAMKIAPVGIASRADLGATWLEAMDEVVCV